jgi:hypothetical protein
MVFQMRAIDRKRITIEALVGVFVALCEGAIGTLKRKDTAVNGTLEQAVRRSVLLAQMSIG